MTTPVDPSATDRSPLARPRVVGASREATGSMGAGSMGMGAVGPRSRPTGIGSTPVGRRAAFTLVELMGVLMLLGMLGGIGFVTWQSMLPKAELHQAVRELAAAINGVRSDAISRNQPFFLEYDFEGDEESGPRYRVVTPYRAGGGLAGPDDDRVALDWVSLPGSVIFKQITFEGVIYDDEILSIRFDPLGTSSSQQIVLHQPQWNNSFTIEIVGLTGTFRFHPGEFSRESPTDSDFR